MLPQIHFNLGPTSVDKLYQIALPLIPGSLLLAGTLVLRPSLRSQFAASFDPHSYAPNFLLSQRPIWRRVGGQFLGKLAPVEPQMPPITPETVANVGTMFQTKIESRSDIFVSTLRKAIEAMGGKLDIRAKFPAGEVRIRQFGGLAGRRRPRSRRNVTGSRAN